jgi:hypothetical protein
MTMGTLRSVVWPASRLGKWAAGAATGSAAALWVGAAAPERVGWSGIGMAGTSVGLALGLAGGVMAAAAVCLRRDRVPAVMAAFVPFAGCVYLVRRSLANPPG